MDARRDIVLMSCLREILDLEGGSGADSRLKSLKKPFVMRTYSCTCILASPFRIGSSLVVGWKWTNCKRNAQAKKEVPGLMLVSLSPQSEKFVS